MKALAALVMAAGLLLSLSGPVCLFSPQKVGMKSRWYALPLSTLFLAGTGLALVISPTANTNGKVEDLTGPGAAFLLLWAMLAYAAFAMANRRPGAKAALPQDQIVNPTRSAAEVDERRRRARREARGVLVEAMPPVAQLTQPYADNSMPVSQQLDEAWSRFQAGDIDIEAYIDAIDEADNDLVDREDELADERSIMDRDDYLDAREQLKEDAAVIKDHRKRARKRTYTESISRADLPESGKWARFEYVDNDGVVTKRNIAMWERRGGYIVGYDRAKKAERTFRQDRISEWVCG